MTDRVNENRTNTVAINDNVTMTNDNRNIGPDMTAGAGGNTGGMGGSACGKRSCRKNRWSRCCLYTAFIALGLGAVLCGVGRLCGGFRQLSELDVEGLTGIPFVYNGHAFGFVSFPPFGDSEWDSRYDGWSRLEYGVGDEDGGMMSGVRLDLTADTLRELDLETGGCLVVIEESADDHVRLTVDGNMEQFRYLAEDGVLRIAQRPQRFSAGGVNNTIRIRLPRGTYLDRLQAEIGAGQIESGRLTVRDADIEVGAGRCAVDRLAADGTVTLSVGAGEIVMDSLVCRKGEFSVGMGDLEIGDLSAADAEVEMSMGEVNLDGEINGSLEVECSTGEVNLNLRGTPEEHNYVIDCSMGTVSVDGADYTGLAVERRIDNGADSNYTIDCSMGTVTVTFAR